MSPRQRAKRWLAPCLIAVVVLVAGVIAFQRVEAEFKNTLESKLTTILEATIHSLSLWSEQKTYVATLAATEPDVVANIMALVEQPQTEKQEGKATNGPAVAIHSKFNRILHRFNLANYLVVDGAGRIIAADDLAFVGEMVDSQWLEQISHLYRGETVFVVPNREKSEAGLTFGSALNQSSLISVASPIIDTDGVVIATVAFGIRPKGDFTRIFSAARAGETGETYAVNRLGWMLSESRFTDQLKSTGKLADSTSTSSVLNIKVSELLEGDDVDHRPWIDLNLEGRNDYRDVRVVSAGRWLPDLGLGVVAKIDYEEAYASHILLRNVIATLIGLAFIGAVGNLVYTRRLVQAQARALRAEREVKQLGQYTLEQRIGEGGMGEVYRASHARLRRPTAVKLLRPERSSIAAIDRFEREVQSTAQLSHPNTIAIYDYGRTSDNVFYYAMEYLEGADLRKVVAHDGPQPDSRVAHVLLQICGSLREAHELGLIHRDIKPANVILCQRGGLHDVAKVLDFGLVHDLTERPNGVNAPGISGTPTFMSPESISNPDSVDLRSDIYAVGALGYFLLAGKNTFEGNSVTEVWNRQLTETPLPPEAVGGQRMNQMLSRLMLRCLAKSPEDRPNSIAELVEELVKCDVEPWTQMVAAKWWHDYRAVADSTSKLSQQDHLLEETIDLFRG